MFLTTSDTDNANNSSSSSARHHQAPPGVVPLPADEESPRSIVGTTSERSDDWLDEPLFSPDGSVPSVSFWEKMWSSSQRLRPVPPLRRRRLIQRWSPSLQQNNDVHARYWWNRYGGSWWGTVGLVVVLAVLWPTGYHSFTQFMKKTDSSFHPMPGTESGIAANVFDEIYNHDYNMDDNTTTMSTIDWNDPMNPAMIMVLESTRNHSLINEAHFPEEYHATKDFVNGLIQRLNDTCWTPTSSSLSCVGPDTFQVRVLSYYQWVELKLQWLANAMTAKDGTLLILEIEYWMPSHVDHHRERMEQLMQVLWDYGEEATATNDSMRLDSLDSRPQQGQKEKDDTLPRSLSEGGENQEEDQQQHSSPLFTVHHTGIKWFSNDLSRSTQSDLARMDRFILPLALLLLGLVLRESQPLLVWIVPLVSMLSTVSAWSIVLNYIILNRAGGIQVTQFTPSIMMSLTLGMGIDYTLFLLSRYLERSGETRAAVVWHMMVSGGQVVLMSGLTLMCTFMGLLLLPLGMLQSIGIGAAVAIGSSMLVNLTIVPALLYFTKLGDWIIRAKADDKAENDAMDDNNHVSSATPSPGDTVNNIDDDPMEAMGAMVTPTSSMEDADNTNPEPAAVDEEGRLQEDEACPASPTRESIPTTSLWYRLARALLDPVKSPWIFIGIMCGILPVAYFATQTQTSINFDLLLPHSSQALQTYYELGDAMGYGGLAPYRILFDGRNASIAMNSEEGFNIMHRVVDELIAMEQNPNETTTGITHVGTDFNEIQDTFNELLDSLGMTAKGRRMLERQRQLEAAASDDTTLCQPKEIQPTQYNGIAVIHNHRLPWTLYESAQACRVIKPFCPIEVFHLENVVDDMVSADHHYATYVTATLGVNPFGDDGLEWLANARETLHRLEDGGALAGVKVYLQGTAAIAHDSVQVVMSHFPNMVIMTLVVVFCLMTLFFQSLFVSIRSVLTMSLTLAFSMGVNVLVFQEERRISTPYADPEVSWLVPIMVFSIIVGLALDYDVFLVSRIAEEYDGRRRRDEHEQATNTDSAMYLSEQERRSRYTHKASIVAGLYATGGIITAAGGIMALAFGGLMFSGSPVLVQWSLVITTAVLLDTLVVRMMLVPILMGWVGRIVSWWPRDELWRRCQWKRKEEESQAYYRIFGNQDGDGGGESSVVNPFLLYVPGLEEDEDDDVNNDLLRDEAPLVAAPMGVNMTGSIQDLTNPLLVRASSPTGSHDGSIDGLRRRQRAVADDLHED